MEKALTTLHANIELHWRKNADLVLSWRIMGTTSTRAFASPRKNWAVSVDHLSPTSPAKMTRPVPRASSGKVASFLRLVASKTWSTALGLAGPSPCMRTLPQGQTVRDHLHPSIIECVELTKVQIADQHVGCNTSSDLSAHLCNGAHSYPTHPPSSKLRDGGRRRRRHSQECPCPACYQPNLGPFGSGCDTRSGGDSISPHVGVSNPASSKARSQLLTAWKHGAGSRSTPSMTMFTTGCLSLIILMPSAQLDQHAAALDLADVSPNPPMDIGKFAVICAASCSSDFFYNWSATYSGDPMGAPNTHIPWSSLGKLGSPLPNNGVRFHDSCNPHQLLNASWGHTAPVPHLCFTLVDINVCVALESSLRIASTATTRSGLQTTTMSQENFPIAAEAPLDCL